MMLYYSIPISVTVLLSIPIFAVLAILVISICLLVSSIQVRIRDINVALPLVLQVLVFTTPIVYPASAVPAALQGALLAQSVCNFGAELSRGGDWRGCSARRRHSVLHSNRRCLLPNLLFGL